ncbi:hypothetical protein C4573_03810 [Candidatus Woesearchaeota archaeon]|nr:MAG: hypothetical protein C4573_03810 [Candidatus Woesearchaeota archaeon]
MVIKKSIEESKSFMIKVLDYVSSHFWRLFIALFIFFILSVVLLHVTPVPFVILGFLFPILILLGSISFIRKSIKALFDHQRNFSKLLLSYTSAVFGFIFLFTLIYIIFASLGIGYLLYGGCNDQFDRTIFTSEDTSMVRDPISIFYFSAITFFTVGYGDICPMGASQIFSILNAFVGQAFTAVIMVLALSSYMSNRD